MHKLRQIEINLITRNGFPVYSEKKEIINDISFSKSLSYPVYKDNKEVGRIIFMLISDTTRDLSQIYYMCADLELHSVDEKGFTFKLKDDIIRLVELGNTRRFEKIND